ncbi:uncharacterized protein LOC132703891 [Cylas formicarius]|uniref:uncharacterized protein LOC132703891 n=1 Tax=Cylas formicarius TaxID=197179 RepID=UPI00295878EA|nr:uncharacterized protein LOC132703891 [Cylas formicarius]
MDFKKSLLEQPKNQKLLSDLDKWRRKFENDKICFERKVDSNDTQFSEDVIEMARSYKQYVLKIISLDNENELSSKLEEITYQVKYLDAKILKLQEEIEIITKDNMECKSALRKGIRKYSKNFNCEISIKDLTDNTFTACLSFSRDPNTDPVFFTIDRKQRQIIDFDVPSIPIVTKNNLRQKYLKESPPNVGALVCHLRNIVLNLT